MPKPAKGPRLGGSPSHERKIIANLCKALIRNESVVTTEARAKRVRPHMEKLITKAKKGDTYNRRLALKVLGEREVAYILFEELAPKFENRAGGYTRIVKLPNRKGDNAPMAMIELVLDPVSPKQAVVKEAEKTAERAAREEAPAEDLAADAEAEDLAVDAEAEDLAVDAEAEDLAVDAEAEAEDLAVDTDAEAEDVAVDAEADTKA